MPAYVSPTFRTPVTPIIRDARQILRELGLVDLLLAHQRVCLSSPWEAFDLVEEALLRLGATNAELLSNLLTDPAIGAPAASERVTGPDPRD